MKHQERNITHQPTYSKHGGLACGNSPKETSNPHYFLLQFMNHLNCKTMKNKERIRKLEAENKRLKVAYMKEVYQRLWTQAQIWKDDEEA